MRKVENEEETYVLMLGILAVTALVAQFINLPGIVGAFLAGLSVNAAVKDEPAKSKLEFMGNTLFISIFFIVTGFLIDPLALARSITEDFYLAAGIIGALVAGKWFAAQTVGRAFGYRPAARKTMWSLTLPQVEATLAATLVAYRTFNAPGQPLVDSRMLNGVLIMVLVIALGPVLTQRFAPRMLESARDRDANGTETRPCTTRVIDGQSSVARVLNGRFHGHGPAAGSFSDGRGSAKSSPSGAASKAATQAPALSRVVIRTRG